MKTKKNIVYYANQWFLIYDDVTNKTLYFESNSLEHAEIKSENIDFNKYKDGEKVYIYIY